jgi:hypothetical protein
MDRPDSASTWERPLCAPLLAGLVSYREYHPCRGLGHVTVLDEAHRVLGQATTATGATEGALVFIDAMGRRASPAVVGTEHRRTGPTGGAQARPVGTS